MREKFTRYAPPVIALVMAVLCCCAFAFYFNPMEDVSLDLSLVPQEDGMVQDPDDFDPKGWTVFVQEGDVRTELIPSGFGGYSAWSWARPFICPG